MSDWVKAKCETNLCVEAVAIGEGTVAIRSSEVPRDKLLMSREEWVTFVAGVKAGDFDTV